MSFQRTVNAQQAPAVAGDFASANPRASVLAGEGGLVAGPGGVTVGRFAWVDDDGKTVVNHGTATRVPDGFVHREQQALVVNYLAEGSNVIPEGFPVTLCSRGDFFATLTGANAAVRGSALFADYSTGEVAAVAIQTGGSVTGSMGATFTASADTDATKLVVTSVTGLISIGDTLDGTGITAGTKIVSQVSGTTGGAGTYQLDKTNTASAATVTAFGEVLKVTAVSSGTLEVGDPVSGTGIPSGAVIASIVSGAGGVGVYTLDTPATAYAASTTVTVVAGVAITNWKAESAAAVGELVKISTWS
jgi:hypothetical protein